jgi:signal recognition particle subunit SRP54
MKTLLGGGMPGMPGIPGMATGGRKAAARAKAAKNAKGKRKSGDPRKAGLTPAPAPAQEPAAAAVESAPQSMEELAELLRDAQAAGGVPGFGDEEGIPGLRGGPSALPPAFGGGRGSNVIPAAFGKRDKKKK